MGWFKSKRAKAQLGNTNAADAILRAKEEPVVRSLPATHLTLLLLPLSPRNVRRRNDRCVVSIAARAMMLTVS